MAERPPQKPRRNPSAIGSDPFADMGQLIEVATTEAGTQDSEVSAIDPMHVTSRPTVARLRPEPNVSMVACPYVGIFDDPKTRFLEPEPAHHCFAGRRSRSIMLAYQTDFCLSPDYRSCEIYAETRATKLSAGKEDSEKRNWFGFLRRLFGRD